MLLHEVQLGKRKDAGDILLAITSMLCSLLELSLGTFKIILQMTVCLINFEG